jgi:predicted metalloprotease
MLFVGCSDEDNQSDDGPAAGGVETVAIPPETQTTDEPALGASPAQVLTDERAAREQKVLSDARALGTLLNDFWTQELSEQYQISFDPPDRYEAYRGADVKTCGGQTAPSRNNAYYCYPDTEEHVAFDLDWFQEYLVRHPGGATTFLILAHEWGHAVQDTWLESGGPDKWDPKNRQELNADCLAGVFMKASIDRGTIVEDADDADAIFGWLREGDSSPWLAPNTHGTGAEREAAFVDGARNGTAYCRTNY